LDGPPEQPNNFIEDFTDEISKIASRSKDFLTSAQQEYEFIYIILLFE